MIPWNKGENERDGPPLVELSGWFVALERLNTRDRLFKLGMMILGTEANCVLSGREMEKVKPEIANLAILWHKEWLDCKMDTPL
ncbi:hypothetical protein PIB30_014804 [Stylosanthes scabra]|uniref:Uncharacterized protein n=1 Tax=Stylosanthes scabra TaxID=79078 RepID=A0ABU6Q6R3_9FABA|nr:hypothetical protein [Stylosanthes scabra]